MKTGQQQIYKQDRDTVMTKQCITNECIPRTTVDTLRTWMSVPWKSIQQLLRYHRLDQCGRMTDQKIARTTLPSWKTDTRLTKLAARLIWPEFFVYAAIKQAAGLEDDGCLTKKRLSFTTCRLFREPPPPFPPQACTCIHVSVDLNGVWEQDVQYKSSGHTQAPVTAITVAYDYYYWLC